MRWLPVIQRRNSRIEWIFKASVIGFCKTLYQNSERAFKTNFGYVLIIKEAAGCHQRLPFFGFYNPSLALIGGEGVFSPPFL
jgi:hypothetical protein